MKGRFTPGQSGNPRGRPKGATNLIGRPSKEMLSEFINTALCELPEIWNALKPKEKAQFLRDILPFKFARLTAVGVSGNLSIKELPDEQLDELALKIFNYGKTK